jgi:hypothetical protein
VAFPAGRLRLGSIDEGVKIAVRRDALPDCEAVTGRLRGPSGVGLPGLVLPLDNVPQYFGGTAPPGAFGTLCPSGVPTGGGVRGNRSGYFWYNARIASILGEVSVDEPVPTSGGVVGGCRVARSWG